MKCPHCAEKVKNSAKVCKHCHRDLPKKSTEQVFKRTAIGLAVWIVALLFIFSQCENDTPSQSTSGNEVAAREAGKSSSRDPKSNYPYNFIDTKTQDADRMDLYAYSGNLDLNNLKRFCKEKKQDITSGTFYYLVIFDSKASATFPKDPFTAAYGMEEEPQRHIRAMYTYNRINGYSKLDYYKDNKLESVAKRSDI